MEDQELDETILKQIQDIDVSKIDILHILIGGTCTEDVPEESHKKYYRDCRESYSVIRSYTDNYFFINIDPRTTPGRNPKNYLHLKYFHSNEPDCMYNLQLKELIEKVLERENTIVIIDNHIFLYLSSNIAEDTANNFYNFDQIMIQAEQVGQVYKGLYVTQGNAVSRRHYQNDEGLVIADNNGFLHLSDKDNFDVAIWGFFKAPKSGVFRFCLRADDILRLWIDNEITGIFYNKRQAPLVTYNWAADGLQSEDANAYLSELPGKEELIKYFTTDELNNLYIKILPKTTMNIQNTSYWFNADLIEINKSKMFL